MSTIRKARFFNISCHKKIATYSCLLQLSSSQQQSYRKTTPPNPPQPKSRPQTPPPLPPSVPSGGKNHLVRNNFCRKGIFKMDRDSLIISYVISNLGSNQGSSQNSKPPPPLTAATTNPPVGLPAPPTTALPPPLPSSSSVSGNNSMHSGVPSVYQQQYSGQPPLPPTGMYPNSGKLLPFRTLTQNFTT